MILREALGEKALRIDQIGSTSITGLADKPIIDIQISIADLHQTDALIEAMTRAGCVYRASNPDLTKRYFRESRGGERTHIHVREIGTWHQRWPLLFRGYMRDHINEHVPFAQLKRALAKQYRKDRNAYTEGKMDYLRSVIRRADRWAAKTAWRPGPSDA